MDIKKIVPWNWFKDEEKTEGTNVPMTQSELEGNPLVEFHREFDRLFDHFWNRMGFPAMNPAGPAMPSIQHALLKPNLDISSSDEDYTIMVEVPGVDENDIRLELVENRMVIEGEKSRESSSRDKDFYRSERSFGSFRRVLTLPDDAVIDEIDARFEKGVLYITIPRKAVPQQIGQPIEIKTAA